MSRPILAIARPEDVGPALRDLRKSQGLLLADVAQALGIRNITNISAWERGVIHPRVGSLVDLLNVYDYRLVFTHQDGVRL